MREAEFRNWLNQRRFQGKALTTVNQRVNWCRAVERALPELGFDERAAITAVREVAKACGKAAP